MPEEMQAWVYDRSRADSNGVYIFKEKVPVPVVGPSDVLLNVLGVSVCGTDEHLFLGKNKEIFNGIIPGHEFFGEVVEVGKDVKNVRKGQKVAGESHYKLGNHSGEGVIGFIGPRDPNNKRIKPLSGAYAEYIAIPAECANVLPEGPIIEDFWPSLLEGMGNDYYLVECLKEKNLIDGHIGIIGCGPHGLYTQIFLRKSATAKTKITAFEIDEYRRGFSRGFGAVDATLNSLSDNLEEQIKELTEGMLFDCVIDSAGGKREVLDMCFKYTKDKGTVILFALYEDESIEIDGKKLSDIIFDKRETEIKVGGKELRIKGITGREGIWQDLIKLVNKSEYTRAKVMDIATIKGSLDQLRDDTINFDREVLKRAYHSFKS